MSKSEFIEMLGGVSIVIPRDEVHSFYNEFIGLGFFKSNHFSWLNDRISDGKFDVFLLFCNIEHGDTHSFTCTNQEDIIEMDAQSYMRYHSNRDFICHRYAIDVIRKIKKESNGLQ